MARRVAPAVTNCSLRYHAPRRSNSARSFCCCASVGTASEFSRAARSVDESLCWRWTESRRRRASCSAVIPSISPSSESERKAETASWNLISPKAAACCGVRSSSTCRRNSDRIGIGESIAGVGRIGDPSKCRTDWRSVLRPSPPVVDSPVLSCHGLAATISCHRCSCAALNRNCLRVLPRVNSP